MIARNGVETLNTRNITMHIHFHARYEYKEAHIDGTVFRSFPRVFRCTYRTSLCRVLSVKTCFFLFDTVSNCIVL